MILTEGLTRRFGPTLAVDQLNLEIADGEIFGLLGPNGAGKTTTVRMLAGLIGVSSGRAVVAGLDVTDPSRAGEVRRLVGVLPEEAGLYGDLSATRTLDFFGRLYRMSKSARSERTEVLLTRLGLWERRDDPASSLSKGLKQRLALARALIHDPQVVLLDEPTANLDPEAAAVVRDVLLELKAQGRTVVVNTHRLEEAERVCDRVGILRTQLLRVGTPHQLRSAMTPSRTFAIELETVRDPDLALLREMGAEELAVKGNRIELTLASPTTTSADLVAALVGGGGTSHRRVRLGRVPGGRLPHHPGRPGVMLTDVLTIAGKDLAVTMRRRSIVAALVAFPLLVGVGLPFVLVLAGRKSGGLPSPDVLARLLTSFQFFFVIGAATLPTTIAAYSLVGEKMERSLEPLLATPVTDIDVLLGKALAAVAPSVASMWVGVTVFMTITDIQAHGTLGYWFFPNTTALLAMLLLVPLVATVSAEVSVLVSARSTDVRSAQQLGALIVIPFAAIYVSSEIGILTLDPASMLALAAGLLTLVVALFFAARAAFNREEILTRWK